MATNSVQQGAVREQSFLTVEGAGYPLRDKNWTNTIVNRDVGLSMDNLYSREAKDFAKEMVQTYARYDRTIPGYIISLHDIPDFYLHEFASILVNQENAYEATGADNAEYEKKMLPALVSFLKNTTDKDKQTDFVNAFRDGVTKYYEYEMKALIEMALENYEASMRWER